MVGALNVREQVMGLKSLRLGTAEWSMEGVELNELALFAGAGFGILGGKLLGWRTVCAVEREPYAASVLVARQNDGILPPFPIWDDVCTFDGKPWKCCVDVVSGGFPCQDISVAGGGGAGIDGEKSGLWAEMARIVDEIRPPFVYVENSPALTVRGLGRVLGDLAALGYDAEWGVLGAVHAGAPHKRERIWIVAYSGHGSRRNIRITQERGEQERKWATGSSPVGRSGGQPQTSACQKSNVAHSKSHSSGAGLCKTEPQRDGNQFGNGSCHASDSNEIHAYNSGLRTSQISQYQETPIQKLFSHSNGQRPEKQHTAAVTNRSRQSSRFLDPKWGAAWWAVEPDVGRVADGVAARVDRLKALGNGQVPAVAASAFRLLSHRFD